MLINFTLIIKADAAKYVHVNTVRSPLEIQTVIHTAFICGLFDFQNLNQQDLQLNPNPGNRGLFWY